MRYLLLLGFAIGCGREPLPVDDTVDAGTIAATDAAANRDMARAVADLAESPDMLCWNDNSSPFCYPLTHDLASK